MDFAESPLATEIFGVRLSGEADSVPEILDSMVQLGRWQSYFAWEAYVQASRLHLSTEKVPPEQDRRLIDGAGNTALHVCGVYHLTKSRGDKFVNEALALANRIPRIGECLKDGVITQAEFAQLVTYTDNIDGKPYCAEIDAAIAAELRGIGVASTARLRDMADRIICRHDPDAVRHRRETAIGKRSAHLRRLLDGMAGIGITASAEDAALAMAAVEAIATSVCPGDPRSLPARRSDAAISQLQGLPFTCQCAQDDCAAATEGQTITDRHAQIVLHVIWEAPTPGGDHHGGPGPHRSPGPHGSAGPRNGPGPAAGHADSGGSADGDSPDDEPEVDEPVPGGSAESTRDEGDRPLARVDRSRQLGFIDGYGVISADHVQDIATRPGTIVRPINPNPGEPLPSHLPSDPYRFSTALDTFIRARDGYCVYPGCAKPAWACDLDHVAEFDHWNPERGGGTCRENANAKCRYHHIAKTFGNWLDDQSIGRDGLTRTEFITPDGYHFHTRGHTNEELFPALADIRFQAPPAPVSRESVETRLGADEDDVCDPTRAGPQRRRSRIADKHARRRRERELNRRARERRGAAES